MNRSDKKFPPSSSNLPTLLELIYNCTCKDTVYVRSLLMKQNDFMFHVCHLILWQQCFERKYRSISKSKILNRFRNSTLKLTMFSVHSKQSLLEAQICLSFTSQMELNIWLRLTNLTHFPVKWWWELNSSLADKNHGIAKSEHFCHFYPQLVFLQLILFLKIYSEDKLSLPY